MTGGHSLPILAWHVAWSLQLLLSRCFCYSFGDPSLISATSSSKNTGVGHVPRQRHTRASSSRHRTSKIRARAAAGAAGDGEEEAAGTAASAGAALVLPRPVDRVVLPAGRGLRVHSLSDLHTDSKANMAWVKTWESWRGQETGGLGEGHEDVLIVAGDISSSLERSAETLSHLKERYDEVFFVVGNHEMWTGRRRLKASEGSGGDDTEAVLCSVEKLVQMHSMCQDLGVRTDPVVFVVRDPRLCGVQEEAHHFTCSRSASLGGENEAIYADCFTLPPPTHLPRPSSAATTAELQLRRGDFLRRWRDYSFCHWPEDLCSREASKKIADFVTVDRDAPPVIAEFFARQNDACIKTFRRSKRVAEGEPHGGEDGRRIDGTGEGKEGADGAAFRSPRPASPSSLISFSHFVPRQELCPEKRLLWEPQLTKVIGSAPLERQIRELGSDVHIFGHTHIPIDMTSDGVRYVQWPLGSTREQSYRTNDMREKGPLLVYSHDGQEGGLKPPTHTLWGEFYETYPRDPHNTDIPENTYEYMKQRLTEGRRRADPSSDPEPPPPL
ncbi:unnamed protein product [Scytosiphon promiscuus]